MPQKYLQYLLIAAVLLIWGIIIYRILNPIESPLTYTIDVQKNTDNFKETADSFYLYANYPDPFIGQEQDTTMEKPVISPAQVVQPAEKPRPDISFIKYHGMISNSNKKIKIAFVEINDKDYLVKEKDKIDGIYFKKFNQSSLYIIYNEETITINKN